MIRLGFNTNGFPCHRLEDAARIVAELGYQGLALTPDVHHLDPFTSSRRAVSAFRDLLEELRLQAVVESGARFLLDPRRKHFPSLMSDGAFAIRQGFLKRCIDLAADLAAPLVSLWSGRLEAPAPVGEAIARLAGRLEPVLDHAAARGVRVALEPEPGMLVGDMKTFRLLSRTLGRSDLWLTLDVGHAAITELEPPHEVLAAWSERIANVHLDDVRGGKHEHLPPGEGEVAFAPILRALGGLHPQPFVSVELSRHGHDAVEQARRTREFLAVAASAHD